jgi:hypothetical protein
MSAHFKAACLTIAIASGVVGFWFLMLKYPLGTLLGFAGGVGAVLFVSLYLGLVEEFKKNE